MRRGSLGHGRLFSFRSITSARIARSSPSSRPMASRSVRAPAMSPASARAAAWRYRSASAEARGLPLDCPRSVRGPPISSLLGSWIELLFSISRESGRLPSGLEIIGPRRIPADVDGRREAALEATREAVAILHTLAKVRPDALLLSRPRSARRLTSPHIGKYVVARFCPFDVSTFFASPSFSTRGISRASSPNTFRISSERSPLGCVFTSFATKSTALAISSGDRRARWPVGSTAGADARAAVGTVFLVDVPRGRPGPRRGASPPPSARRSSRDDERMASTIEDAKFWARSLSAEWRVGIERRCYTKPP